MALERGAGPERDQRHAMARCNLDDLLHFFRRFGPDHSVRRLVRHPGERVAVLAADGLSGLKSFTEPLPEHCDGGFDVTVLMLRDSCRSHPRPTLRMSQRTCSRQHASGAEPSV